MLTRWEQDGAAFGQGARRRLLGTYNVLKSFSQGTPVVLVPAEAIPVMAPGQAGIFSCLRSLSLMCQHLGKVRSQSPCPFLFSCCTLRHRSRRCLCRH